MSRRPQHKHEQTGPSAEGDAADATARQPGPKDDVARLQQQLDEARDRHLRTLAEAENTRKRLEQQHKEYAAFATQGLIQELLPLVDSLDQALVAAEKPSDAKAMVQGIQLIRQQLSRLLDQEGVERIPTVGEPFDPHRHEAVAHVETDDGNVKDTVIEEVHAGFTMHGKVVRPAMVKVAKGTAGDAQPSTDSEEPSQKEHGTD